MKKCRKCEKFVLFLRPVKNSRQEKVVNKNQVKIRKNPKFTWISKLIASIIQCKIQEWRKSQLNQRISTCLSEVLVNKMSSFEVLPRRSQFSKIENWIKMCLKCLKSKWFVLKNVGNYRDFVNSRLKILNMPSDRNFR